MKIRIAHTKLGDFAMNVEDAKGTPLEAQQEAIEEALYLDGIHGEDITWSTRTFIPIQK